MLQEDTPKWADEGLNGEVRMLLPFSDGVYDFNCMLPAGDPRIRRKPKITDYIVKRLSYPIPTMSNPKHRKLIMDFLTSIFHPDHVEECVEYLLRYFAVSLLGMTTHASRR